MPGELHIVALLHLSSTPHTQGFCSGVGNWVADEVLWQARLHPEQLVSAMGEEHTAALHKCLQEVVQTAVAADADSSKFPADWMFHVRWVWSVREGRQVWAVAVCVGTVW